MAFIRKMVFQRKSNASPINLWNKILGQFKLRVYLQYSRDLRPLNLQLYWWIQAGTWTAFETLAQIRLFFASLNTKSDSRFYSGNFSKGKAFYCAKVSYELLDYNTSLTCIFLYFCRICNSYHLCTKQNGFSVGNYSLKCSHFSRNKSL